MERCRPWTLPALAFWRREEEALVDTFILETLAYFVDSLKLALADERTVGEQGEATGQY